ncbi:odorant receptor 49a-like [Drosophila nasuta]|uniref:odorant receptor 49a-like n=1 Tax=Drosophila nasuta TaxID=42062 RepID=UPI00295F0BD8|nr:odorant receptor 49a-like [Drosophila nasuta]
MKTFGKEIQRSYEDFIYIPSIMFKSIGYDILNTPKPRWQDLLMRCYFLIGLGSHYYIIYYMMLRIIQWDTLSGDPVTIVRYAEIFFLSVNSEIKIVTFIYYRNRIRELCNELGRVFPSENSERQYYNVNSFYWPRVIRYGVYYFCFVVLLVVFAPLVQSTCIYLYQRFTIGSEAKFPYLRAYPMQLSFDAKTPLRYLFAEILEFTSSHFYMTFNIGTDIWMMCLSGQICMHFAHLGRVLANYSPSYERSSEDCEFLVRVVRKHRQVLSFHKELNDMVGMLLAYNLFTTASTLCCVAFYTIVRGLNLEGVSFLSYFFSCAAQFYMVCYYGQKLIDLSEALPKAAYSQTWYNGSLTYRKLLLIIMLNTGAPVVLSAKGIIIISLDTFKNMMNITYKFFAIVRRLLDD